MLKAPTKLPGRTLQNQVAALFEETLLAPAAGLSVESPYAHYSDDPIRFIREVLREDITEDIEELCRAFLESSVVYARSANGTGKTHAAARLAVWYYLVWSDAKVFCAAAPPLDNLENLLWGEISGIVRRNPHLFKGHKVNNLRIQRHSESYLTGVTIPVSSNPKEIEGKFSGKHAPHLAFFLDECDQIPIAVFTGIESCMSGGDVHLLGLFNPRQEAGEPYQAERQRRARIVHLSAFRHPNVITGRAIFPGAVDRETTVRRINLWSRPLARGEKKDAEAFEVPAFLVGYVAKNHGGIPFEPLAPGWRKITNPSFSYMVLGEYPAAAVNQLIAGSWVDAAVQRWLLFEAKGAEAARIGVRPIASLDVAEEGGDLNILTFSYGGFVEEQIEWSGVDVLVTGDRAAEHCINRNALFCNVDSNGPGAGVAPQMRRAGFKAARRIMVQSSAPENENPATDEAQCDLVRDLMLWKTREWLRTDPSAMLPPDDMLREELVAPLYTTGRGGRIKVSDTATLKEILRRSPDRLMSLALRFAPRPVGTGQMKSESYI